MFLKKAGDVVLFDCRVLHFGLANLAKGTTRGGSGGSGWPTWRPTLYSNVTQRWFEDKKNWEQTSLFSASDCEI